MVKRPRMEEEKRELMGERVMASHLSDSVVMGTILLLGRRMTTTMMTITAAMTGRTATVRMQATMTWPRTSKNIMLIMVIWTSRTAMSLEKRLMTLP